MSRELSNSASHIDADARVARVLVARVGAERIALAVESVAEVLEAPAISSLPLTPAGVLGQCLWRAQVVPVLDPHVLFGIGAAAAGRRGVVLVVARAGGPFALLVDDVEEVLELHPDLVRAVPPGSDRAGRLSALLRTPDGLVAVVDVAALSAAADATLQSEVRA